MSGPAPNRTQRIDDSDEVHVEPAALLDSPWPHIVRPRHRKDRPYLKDRQPNRLNLPRLTRLPQAAEFQMRVIGAGMCIL